MCESYGCDSGDEPLDDAMRDTLLREVDRMSELSLRVLAVCRRVLEKTDAPASGSGDRKSVELEEKLTFVGLVGMIDPPRVGVVEAIRACADAHVRAVMITGDHKLTAVAIARELGLWDEGAIALTGSELEKMNDQELAARVDSVRVFARVRLKWPAS
jgi:Ca2+-transporting ATPase